MKEQTLLHPPIDPSDKTVKILRSESERFRVVSCLSSYSIPLLGKEVKQVLS